MAANYTHTQRVVTCAEPDYNTDHNNHVTNFTAAKVDDYSDTTSQMRTQDDPGEVATESLAITLSGELARIRYTLAEMKGTTYWYQSNVPDYETGTTTLYLNAAAPTGWTFLATLADRVVMLATAESLGSATGGTWTLAGLQSVPHDHTNLLTVGALTHTAQLNVGTGVFSFLGSTHTHALSGGFVTATSLNVFSDGTWRPLYVDAIPCRKD